MRSPGAALRLWALIVTALVFGQITALAHSHDTHDDSRVPVACDMCLSAVSDDEALYDDAPEDDKTGSDPDVPPAFTVPDTHRMPDAVPAPVLDARGASSGFPSAAGHALPPARAPPV